MSSPYNRIQPFTGEPYLGYPGFGFFADPQDPRIKFRYGSRIHKGFQMDETKSFTLGTTQEVPIKMNKTGYLNQLLVEIDATQTLSSGVANAAKGPFNLVRNFQFEIDNGGATIINRVPGDIMHVIGGYVERGAILDKAGIGNTTPRTSIYSAPVATGANTWKLWYRLPISPNTDENAALGLIPLAVRDSESILTLTLNTATAVNPNSTATTGTIKVFSVYFDAVDEAMVQPPPRVLTILRYSQHPINSTGITKVEYPIGGAIMQSFCRVCINDLPSNNWSWSELVVGNGAKIDHINRTLNDVFSRQESLIDPLDGWFVRDYFHATGELTGGDWRDFVNTEAAADVRLDVYVDGPLSGSSYIEKVDRIIMVQP